MSTDELTTAEAAERLGESQRLVRLWCKQGRFPHARAVETLRGPVWLIPVRDLDAFVKPKPGPAPKATPAPEKRAPGQAGGASGAVTGRPAKKAAKKRKG